MIKKIKSIKDTVLQILKDEPRTRDNDRMLMFKVWAVQNPGLRNPTHYLYDFANAFIRGSYADPESIRRSRQKIQERHPELRGKTYTIKRDRCEPEMRDGMPKLEI